MSSPKTSSYRVNAQATREALQQARDQANIQKSELERIHQQYADLADRYPGENLGIDLTIPREPTAETGFSGIESYRKQLQDLCLQRQGAISAVETRIKTRRMLGALVGPDVGPLQTVADIGLGVAPTIAGPAQEAAGARSPWKPELIQEKLEKRLANLDPLVGEHDRTKIDALIARLVEARVPDKAELLLQEITRCAGEANRNAAVRRQHREEARSLLDKLSPLPGAEAEICKRTLREVEAGRRAMTDPLRLSVARAIKSGECHYADGVLKDALARMGYEVEEEFQTIFAEGGTIHFSRPGWKEYSVRLRISPADASLNYNMVRDQQAETEDTREQALRDKEMEASWCTEFSALQDHLKDAGLVCRLDRHLPAGSVPVQVRKGAGSARATGRRAEETRPANRERER